MCLFSEKKGQHKLFRRPIHARKHDPRPSKESLQQKSLCTSFLRKNANTKKTVRGQKRTPEMAPEALDATKMHSSTRRVRKSAPERRGSLPDPSFGGRKIRTDRPKIGQKCLVSVLFRLFREREGILVESSWI